jgi:hypothetical protein
MFLLALLLFVPGCREDEALVPNVQGDADPHAITYANIPFNEKGKMMEKFGIGIAEALKNPSFRKLLRAEALRKVNGDHDVLYHQIKNDPMQDTGPIVYDGSARTASPGVQTLHSFLVPFFESEAELHEYEARLPLLTIFVPTLPEGSFSPATWDPTDPDQIPDVALRLNNISYVPVIGRDGENFLLEPDITPGWPIVVLKENERILHRSDPGFGQFDTQFVDKAGYPSGEYRLWAEGFLIEIEGEESSLPQRKIYFGDTMFTPPHLAEAFNTWYAFPGGGWHRDFLYYSLTPQRQNGIFTGSTYVEYMTSFGMNAVSLTAENLFNFISDDFNGNNDPKLKDWQKNKSSAWTEGQFDFEFFIFQNDKPHGSSVFTSSPARKGISLGPELLFDIVWESRIKGHWF